MRAVVIFVRYIRRTCVLLASTLVALLLLQASPSGALAQQAPFLASAMSGDLALSVNSCNTQDSFANAFGDTTRPRYGKYLLLTVTVVDKGDKALKLNPKMFALRDRRGRQFTPNSLSDRQLFFDALVPGKAVTGRLVFDIPADADAPKLAVSVGNGKTALIELQQVQGATMSGLGTGRGTGRRSGAVAGAGMPAPGEGNATAGLAPGGAAGSGHGSSGASGVRGAGAAGTSGAAGAAGAGGAPLGVAMAGPFNFAVMQAERRQSYRDAFYEWVTSSFGVYLTVGIMAQNMDTAPHGLEQRMFSVRDGQGRQYTLNPMSDRQLFAKALKPGGSATGVLVFELPADARNCVLAIQAEKEGATLASAEIPLP